jgi:hypothetical protein
MPTHTQIILEPATLTNLGCTKCGSTEVRRLSLIYNEGLAIINTTSNSTGQAFGSGGGAAFGSSSTRTTGTQQTALSKQAAPPKKKHTILWGIAAGVLGFMALGGLSDFSFSVVLFAGLAALAGRMSLKAKEYNATKFPEQYATWERSFMCNRCGQTFAA